nr:MAG TPA: hypothetical protein [Caudoviricetes sp.]
MQGRGALQRQPPRDRPRGRTPKRQRRRHRTDLSTFKCFPEKPPPRYPSEECAIAERRA